MYKVIKTVNKYNGNYYLGIINSKDEKFDKQLGLHIYTDDPNTYQFSKTKFQCAVKLFGIKSFKVEVLAVFNDEISAFHYLELILTPEIVASKECYNNCYPTIMNRVYVYNEDGLILTTIKDYLDFDSALNGLRIENTYVCSTYDVKGFSKAKKMNIQNRKVYKYDIDGNFLEEYESQVVAEKLNKYSNITKSIKLKQPCKNNFFWSLQLLPKLHWSTRKGEYFRKKRKDIV